VRNTDCERLCPPSRNVQARYHVASHAALELIAGNPAQLLKNVVTILADIEVGIWSRAYTLRDGGHNRCSLITVSLTTIQAALRAIAVNIRTPR